MKETYLVQAIILNRSSFRENDSRVVVYSRERGKMILIARGTKSIKSKMAGHIEPFCFSDIMVVRGCGHSYIGGVKSRYCFVGLKSSLEKISAAGFAAGVFDRAIRENESDKDLFVLLKEYLSVLNDGDWTNRDIGLLTSSFIFRLFSLLGFRPELNFCVSCGKKPLSDRIQIDIGKGGIICPDCSKNQGLRIGENVLKILRYALTEDMKSITRLQCDEKNVIEALEIMKAYTDYYLA